MTEPASIKPDLGRFGVWTHGPVTPAQAVEIEQLGYGAVWVGGSPSAELDFAEPILTKTTSLTVATGIVNIWSAPAHDVAQSFHRIEAAHPGRFLLGVGVGHPEVVTEYRKPYGALVDYLDELDAHDVPKGRRVIAALGEKVLRLAAERSAGAHPYLTTAQHTVQARKQLGESVFLAPEQGVVLADDVDAARSIGREAVGFYLGLSNYVSNWNRLGFNDDDVAAPGSDRLIDALVALGSAEDVATRLNEHVHAGADHVTIQVLGQPDQFIPTLTALSKSLGLVGPS